MRFNKGRRLLSLILNREHVKRKGDRIKFYNRYLLPFFLLIFLSAFLVYRNQEYFSPAILFFFTTCASLSISAFLFFRLSQESAGRKRAESGARINASRLSRIEQAGIIGILFTRFDGVITQANDAFLEIIGYDRSDLENELISWVTMTPPEFKEISDNALNQLRTMGLCAPFEKEYVRKDGSRVSVLLGSALLNPDDPAEIITYAVDVSNLKEAEKRERAINMQARHKQEEMLRILQNAPVAIMIRRGPELEIEYANQKAVSYTSLTVEDLIGSSAENFHAKLKTSYDTKALKEVYNTGKPVKGNAGHVLYDRYGTGNLAEGWFDYLWEPITDSDGTISGVATFTFEVTELVKANKELKANENRFRFIADAIPHKMWTSGPDGTATYYNRGWSDYLQATDFEELREKVWQSIHPDELERVKRAWELTIEKGEDLELEQRFRRHDGEYLWHLTRVSACKDEAGKVLLYVGSSTNIHEQRMAQIGTQLLMEKKDEFLGIATHELRTPITSMKASLQSLEKIGLKDEDLKKHLPLISLANRQVNKLAGIVNDLVDVSKIQSCKLQLNKTDYSFSDALQESIAEMRQHNPEYQFILEQDSPEIIHADRTRVEQVISILLSNAIKYSPGKNIILIRLTEDGPDLKLAVIDSGIGIPAAQQRFVFDRFFRVHSSSHLYSGLGLGLFIAAEIVKEHHGRIGMESEEGKGSVFWFTMPAKR